MIVPGFTALKSPLRTSYGDLEPGYSYHCPLSFTVSLLPDMTTEVVKEIKQFTWVWAWKELPYGNWTAPTECP